MLRNNNHRDTENAEVAQRRAVCLLFVQSPAEKQFSRSAFSLELLSSNSKENQLMIRRMSHATIFVNNQNEALEFYRDKLGFKVHTDAMVGPDFRWLTMCTNDQPDFEIVLLEPKPGMMMDEETSNQLRAIMAKGVLGAGVFNTDD